MGFMRYGLRKVKGSTRKTSLVIRLFKPLPWLRLLPHPWQESFSSCG